jgi:hypothetical protein
VDQSDDDVWKTTDMGWGVYPEGIRKVINYIQKEYNPKGGIIITENGCAVAEEEVEDALKDIERAVYIKVGAAWLAASSAGVCVCVGGCGCGCGCARGVASMKHVSCGMGGKEGWITWGEPGAAKAPCQAVPC